MLPLRKIFGRKPEDHTEDESGRGVGRRHSSVRSNSSSTSSTSSSNLSPRRSLIFIRSPFKNRDSVSSCRDVGTCPGDLGTEGQEEADTVLQSVDVVVLPDENGNRAEDKAGYSDTIKMNGTYNHGITSLIFDERETRRFSVIEKKILSMKQNTLSADADRHESLRIDAVNHQSSAQGVPDTDAVNTPRLFTKRSGATLPSRCSSSFSGGYSRSPVSPTKVFPSQSPGLHSTSSSTSTSVSGLPVGLQNGNLTVDAVTKSENSHNSSNSFSRDLSTSGNRHADTTTDQQNNIDSTPENTSRISSGISGQTAGFPASPFGRCTTAGSAANSDSPVPPPRRNRNRLSTLGRLSYVDDLSSGVSSSCLNEGQQISSITKSRSLSELYFPGAEGAGSSDEVNSAVEDSSQSRSSTNTSGISSDLSSHSVTPLSSDSSSSSSSSACASNSEQSEQQSSVVGSLPSTSASDVTATASLNCDQSHPVTSLIDPTLSSSTATTSSGSNVDPVQLQSSLANLALAPTLASNFDGTGSFPVDGTLASSSSSSSCEHTQQSSSSHSVTERLLTVTSDKGGSGTPLCTHLRMREFSAHPVTSLRALRYSSNCVGDLSNQSRSSLCSPTSDSKLSPLARMTGLTLEHVMTPLRVTMTTEKPAAVSGHSSPSVVITEAETSQLAEDKRQIDSDQSVAHETDNERFVLCFKQRISVANNVTSYWRIARRISQ